MYPRLLQKDISKWIERPEIIIINGARQTGKTTLLKLIEKQQNAAHRKTFYFSLENFEYLNLLNTNSENLFKLIGNPPSENGPLFVFIDEIQYLENPTQFMKYIYDTYQPGIKLIVTGSSSFYMDRKFKDSLVGRKQIFTLKPLNFYEFLIFKERDDLAGFLKPGFQLKDFDYYASVPLIQKNELQKYYSEFIRYGGFPGIVRERETEFIEMKLADLVYSYIRKDALEAKLSYPEKYLQILKIIAERSGQLLNQNEISKTLGVSTTALTNYLYVMQKSFHVALIPPYFGNVRKEIRKMPKAFLLDAGIRNALLNSYEPIQTRIDRGFYFENLVFIHLFHRFGLDALKFWRTQDQKEIDFIVNEKLAVEAKFQASAIQTEKYNFFQKQFPDMNLIFSAYDLHRRVGDYFCWELMFL